MMAPADVDNLKALLELAVLAPSSHNTQPWQFRLQTGQIELHADFSRTLPVNDPAGRELHISCGCALFNLRVAAAEAGWALHINSLPDPAVPALLARVQVLAGEGEAGLAGLTEAVLLRRTYRNRFQAREPTPELATRLELAVRSEGAALQWLNTADERQALIAMVREGDNRQWQNEAWRQELAQWLHGAGRGEGLSVPGLVAPLVRGVVRHFDMGRSLATQDGLLADESPALMVLSTVTDEPQAWLEAGQALQRLLLEAQREGLQASYLNQPLQVAELRTRLQQALALEGYPQVLMRMGYPEERLAASPRRPLDDVILP
ncbi:Acg family FMN-binding oxidoreductase [Marinobacterium weihaiense]|uniref:Nitroreductase family protein n=1 Tax=Marinobacterium weihaiense TaxID=2851016 RepID=A0ABS6MA50_9GAMM|nr:nitroreductase family protein [Marinobacterium weihaiense]MBV0932642.1 nitroreductase family protein [Marinobacterium weihaiense]